MAHETEARPAIGIILSSYRHAYVLAALLLVIVGRPFVGDRLLGGALLNTLFIVTLLAAVFAAASGRRQVIALGAMAGMSVLFQIVWLFTETSSLGILFLAWTIIFCSTACALLVSHLFRPGAQITSDTIYGSLSVYLLLGILSSLAFAALELLIPGSCTFGDTAAEHAPQVDRFLGFSFATLTTVGYGNIAPATPCADALSTLEAIAGQFYLVVVVARLVAMQLSHESSPPAA